MADFRGCESLRALSAWRKNMPKTNRPSRFADGIESVAVIGAGTMGAQIAALTAFSGRTVRLFDAIPEAIDRAANRIEREILPAIAEARQISGDSAAARERLTFVPTLAEAVTGVDLVIEAVREDVDVKREVFADLSRLAPAAILGTNSSSIRSAQVTDVVERPE